MTRLQTRTQVRDQIRVSKKRKPIKRSASTSNMDSLSWLGLSGHNKQWPQGDSEPFNFNAPISAYCANQPTPLHLHANSCTNYQSPFSAVVPKENTEQVSRDRTHNSTVFLGSSEALHPSLLQPTPPVEQENHILIMQEIGKAFQLAVKDSNIEVRDNRIKSKDNQIAELDAENGLKDTMLSMATMEKRNLEELVARQSESIKYQSDELDAMQSELEETGKALKDREAALEKQDQELRSLRNKLKEAKTEIIGPKGARLVNQILRYIYSVLGARVIPVQPSASTFPFMRLPGELRIKIYKECLVVSRPIDFWPIRAPNGKVQSPAWNCTNGIQQINPSLLRVSRQIHGETVGMLYGCNRFRFSDQGGWTVLLGFLRHINSNCQYLTNISVCYPDEFAEDHAFTEDLADTPALKMERASAMKAVVHSFGRQVLDSPTGPSSASLSAYLAACEILIKLSHLNQISIVVPHSLQLDTRYIDTMANALTSKDKDLGARLNFDIEASPKRILVIIRRSPIQSRFCNWVDLDDDVAMNRALFVRLCTQQGVTIKGASYGSEEELISYKVDGGEDEYDIAVPTDLPQYGRMILQSFRAAKSLFGY
jgi:hypothetical protein